jgi:hypothetical protein
MEKNGGNGFDFGDDDVPLATSFRQEAGGGSMEVMQGDLSRRADARESFPRVASVTF